MIEHGTVAGAPPTGIGSGGPAVRAQKTKRRRLLPDRFLARYSLALFALALFVFFSVAEADTFPTRGNIQGMLTAQAVSLILAMAVLLPLRAGDFDLSIAAVMVLATLVNPLLVTNLGFPPLVSLVATLLIGAAIGLVHAVFIVALELNAFVVTLGSMTILGGVAIAISGGQIQAVIPDVTLQFARSTFLSIPVSVWVGWALSVLLWYVFERTPFGRHLLFVGGNRDAARLAGVRVARVRACAFVASGLVSALAGLMLVGTLGAADPTIAGGYLLPPYAAAFLGIAAVQLGRFNVWGTFLATYLLVVATTGLLLLGSAPWVTDIFNGSALVIAILFAYLAEKSSGKAG